MDDGSGNCGVGDGEVGAVLGVRFAGFSQFVSPREGANVEFNIFARDYHDSVLLINYSKDSFPPSSSNSSGKQDSKRPRLKIYTEGGPADMYGR